MPGCERTSASSRGSSCSGRYCAGSTWSCAHPAGRHRDVVFALDSPRYLRLVADLERFLADPPFSDRGRGKPTKELRRRVRKACRRVERARFALRDADPAQHDHALHEVRISAKRARYAAEAARPVIGDEAKAVADAMEQIQETLGDHQDAVVERAWLRDLAVRAFLAGENSFTFGRLHGLTDALAQHDEEEFEQIWTTTHSVVSGWPGW